MELSLLVKAWTQAQLSSFSRSAWLAAFAVKRWNSMHDVFDIDAILKHFFYIYPVTINVGVT